MQILSLKFSNLNSLYDEWHIDFTAPEFNQNGVFIISGATGSGKTTILDAICLALYGKTPRQETLSANLNQLMSQGASGCSAEVIFSCAQGQFICSWHQRRAHNKPEGALQPAKHEIACAADGKILANQLRTTPAKVEELTGLDFQAFTRSVLLAQGNFDKFLKAPNKDKSDLLEQITGTQIYSLISQRAFERHTQAQADLANLKSRNQNLNILSADAEQELREQQQACQSQQHILKQQLNNIQTGLNWYQQLNQTQSTLNQLTTQQLGLEAQIQAFAPQQIQLRQAQQANLLLPAFARLNQTRTQLQQEEHSLALNQAAVTQAQQQQQDAVQKHELAQTQLNNSLIAQTEAQPLLQQVRQLDSQLATQQQEVRQAQAQLHANQQHLTATQQQLEQAQAAAQTLNTQLEQAKNYLTTHQADAWLNANLSAVQLEVQQLNTSQNQLIQLEAQTLASQQEFNLQQQAIQQQEQALQELAQQEANCLNQITLTQQQLNQLLQGRLAREYKQEQEHLQQQVILLNRISSLEEQRRQLEANQPCPLCGATEHPFATGGTPELNSTAAQLEQLRHKITQIDALTEQLQLTQQNHQQASHQLHLAQHNLNSLQATAAQQHQQLTSYTEQVANYKQQHRHLLTRLETHLAPLGIHKQQLRQTDLITKLEARLQAWLAAQEQQLNLEAQLNNLASQISRFDGQLTSQIDAINSQKNLLEQREQLLYQQQQERQQLYGTQDPNQVEQQLNAKVEKQRQHLHASQNWLNELDKKLAELNSKNTDLQARLSKLQQNLAQAMPEFQQQLEQHGWHTEQDFNAACLSQEIQAQLAAQERQLEQSHISLQTRIKSQQEQLENLQQQALTSSSFAELTAQLPQIEQQVEANNQRLIQLGMQLAQQHENKQLLAQQLQEQQRLEQDCLIWAQLNALIGSRDGTKFRIFAQGLTFELLLSQANQQLQKLSDRYLLVSDKNSAQPFELNVLDNYQGAKQRSISNLSGGETFILSLALALGLAQMNSHTSQISSLFLDEGFGTLDEHSLNIALEALASLQEEGKLIGLISHVKTLQERIATQIHLHSNSQGRSTIQGPGVSRI